MLVLGESERFEPWVDGFQVGVRKVIVKLLGSPFDLLKDTYNRVPIAVGFMAKMYSELELSGVELGCPVNEKLGIFSGEYLLQLPMKQLRGDDFSSGVDPNVGDCVGFRIDGGNQRMLLAIDLDDCLVEVDPVL